MRLGTSLSAELRGAVFGSPIHAADLDIIREPIDATALLADTDLVLDEAEPAPPTEVITHIYRLVPDVAGQVAVQAAENLEKTRRDAAEDIGVVTTQQVAEEPVLVGVG